MLLRELFESKASKVVAIMPGGFHPFHPGHKSLYDWAVKTFGKSNVYVAATNDTETRPFPFEVKKKLAAMAGVPASNFMQVNSPFNNREYAQLLDDNTALVFVRSEKDKGEEPLPDRMKIDRKTKQPTNEPRYLRSYTGKDLNTHDEMGYMAYGPTINFDFSGMKIKSASELRSTWPEMSDDDKLKAAKLMYGNGAEVAVKLLNQALGDPEAPVGENVSPEEEDKFHRKLDKLVHKTFGHSSDEKKKKPKNKKVDEFNIFKSVDNADPKLQDPNKIKVLGWIGSRTDNKEHFLSFYKPGAVFSGNLIFLKPDQAKKFMRIYDDKTEYQKLMRRALTSVQTAATLFKNLNIKHDIRKYNKR